ncbi:MAG: hypothetical protein R3F19_30940 [Verrucomicrobiales bacterium]
MALSLAFAGVVHAAPIAGTIKIASIDDPGFAFDTAANTVSFGVSALAGPGDTWNSVVTSSAGDYAGLTLSPATYQSFAYDPLAPSPIISLWEIGNTGSSGISFDLESISFIDESASGLTLKGLGTAHLPGFESTPGSWVFTASAIGGEFGFDSINVSPVPEGGTSLALLGVALLGFGGARRMFSVR